MGYTIHKMEREGLLIDVVKRSNDVYIIRSSSKVNRGK